jgi:putative transposase
MMQSLGRYYARYVNNTYKRTGTLWEGKYKSTLVDSERYLLTVYRYIELNPVRASMVETAGDYPWSSFQSNALGKYVELITPHALYEGRR